MNRLGSKYMHSISIQAVEHPTNIPFEKSHIHGKGDCYQTMYVRTCPLLLMIRYEKTVLDISYHDCNWEIFALFINKIKHFIRKLNNLIFSIIFCPETPTLYPRSLVTNHKSRELN